MNSRLWTWLLVPCLAIGVAACEMDVDDDDPDVVAPAANGDEPETNIIDGDDPETNIIEGPELEVPEGPEVEGPEVEIDRGPQVNESDAPEAPDAAGQGGVDQQP